MTTTDGVLIAVAVVLVLAAGVIAAMEAALGRVSRVAVEDMVRQDRRGAGQLTKVLADPARFLNLLLLLRVGAELAATTLATVVAVAGFGTDWPAVVVTVAVMTPVSYVFIGVAPRTVGLQRATAVAPRAASLALALTKVFGPVSALLILVGNAITPGRGFREGPFASEAELRDLVDLAEERKVIEHGEREMIHGVFELGDTLVREVMVPRTDIVFIERGKTARQAQSLALRSGFSRVPVVGDSSDDVIGIAYLKDLVRRTQDARGSEPARVEDVMRPATFVPESKAADELLREMQAQQIHMAVVIDEYGGTAGLVTIEDILEEIVGEIADEYDREVPPVEEIDATTTRVTARLPVEDVEQMYDVELAVDDVETVGGLMAQALGRVPIPGATITLQGLTFTAEGVKGRRNMIGTVMIEHPPHTAADDGEGADAVSSSS